MMKKASPDSVHKILTRNAVNAIDRASLERKLTSGKKLRIKLGCDPTRPDLHLGHAVVLRRLRALQDLGHTVVFIIGDFTARIGDPSGRANAKKSLTAKEAARNSKTYFDQVAKFLDVKKAEIRKNSQWLSKLSAEEIIRLAGQFTAARILERDDFAKRLKAGTEVWLHELLYPIFQGYDSVAVKADIEIGGTDQLFNFLAARHLMEKLGMPPQDIITFEILPGLDGKEKMSKSLDNYIGVTESQDSMFGKAMSLPDSSILLYFKLTTDRNDAEIQAIKKRLKSGENPRDIKLDLAQDIVSLYHGAVAGEKSRAEFIKVFSKKELPSAILQKELRPGSYEIVALLMALGMAPSKSEARRLVEQGAVEIIPKQGLAEKIRDSKQIVSVTAKMVVRVGKTRFMRIK
ncbi:MAG: tyrosine--tRNA ligase [Candidatus Sungbacteria bacterium]|uniref:Tyrosine--tRNA ligase n=1 Tax=Candidatus Sungiibacteriota bacterium TaxID=2750080 RepID=A0A9D6LPR0_9BACT|nr:tyrosine--tRNA ligase [Candidatus Sungbacteria bacterium]